ASAGGEDRAPRRTCLRARQWALAACALRCAKADNLPSQSLGRPPTAFREGPGEAWVTSSAPPTGMAFAIEPRAFPRGRHGLDIRSAPRRLGPRVRAGRSRTGG